MAQQIAPQAAASMEEGENFFVKISNISSLLGKQQLSELFECCGQIKRIDMRRDADGRVCIVQFSHKQEMEAASLLSGTPLGDLPLRVKNMTFEEVREMVQETEKQPESMESSEAMDEIERARKQVEEWANAPAASAQSTANMTEADKLREEQIRKTIYVGNLHPNIMEEHIKSFFSTQGEILYVKMSAPGLDQRYCFVEFVDEASALRSFSLTGTVLGDRPVKVGKATTPISKNVGPPTNILSNPVRLYNAMSHVRNAVEKLARLKGNVVSAPGSPPDAMVPAPPAPEAGTRSRRRRRRSRSSSRRSSCSRSRSRSRSRRGRRRRRRRSYDRRSRSRSRSRGRRSRGGYAPNRNRLRSTRMWKRTTNVNQGKTNMVWDGFQWHPKDSAEGVATKTAANAGQRGPAGYPGAGNDSNTVAATWAAGKTNSQLAQELAQEALKNHNFSAPPGI